MRQITRAALLSAALGAAIAASPAEAATSVAYLDGKEVWVANTDGSNKTRLSGGEGDWRQVSQNPAGWIIGVQLEANKISDLSRFTVWNPQGAITYQGPLVGKAGGAIRTYPNGLDLTLTGGAIVYGQTTTGPAYAWFQSNFNILPSSTVVAPALGPGTSSSARFVALTADDRVVGIQDDRTIGIQEPGSVGSSTFAPWVGLGTNPPSYQYATVDVSSNAGIVVSTVWESVTGGGYADHVNVTKTASAGGDVIDDCFLGVPVAEEPSYPTVSPDGTLIAWQQIGGVKITGTPNLRAGGPSTCELTTGVTTISATGSYPSLGGFDAAAYFLTKNPPAPTSGGGGTGGSATTGGSTGGGGAANTAPPALVVKVGKAPKLSNGSSSQSLKITPQATGTAKVTITIDPKRVGQKGKTPISLATGSQKVTAGKQATVKLKPSKKAKSLKKKLKGKKATITITVGTAVYTGTIKLG